VSGKQPDRKEQWSYDPVPISRRFAGMRIVRKLTHELTVDLRTAGLFPAEIGQPSSVSSRQRRARPLTKRGRKMFRRQLDSELAYLPREFLAGFSAASVLINSVANLGGFAGPYAIGAVGRTREVLYTTKLEINRSEYWK
jgi:hypothetical protein